MSCENCKTELCSCDHAEEVTTSGFMQVTNTFKVEIKKLTKNAKTPTRGSEEAAGYDLYADLKGAEELTVPAHGTKLVGTGLAMKLPQGTFLGIYPRSGLASKKGLRPANTVGVIDSDYRGEIMIALHNDTEKEQMITDGERIAQGILQSYMPMSFDEVDELSETARGYGSFGSTGTN